ncbi:MAG: tetraacyldisaccharide 4'-kinase, partial [Desulfobulbaceae bacterium]|nr:tetraacyldisaccharide 4'-kinase [Desulfobulbaceae bacterium]
HALEKVNTDVIIMDDGFQHMALRRDLDIVLFNIRSTLDAARVFPAGELREPFSALRRADAIVLTGVDGRTEQKAHAFKRFLRERAPQAPVFYGEYLPVCLLSNDRDGIFPTDKAKAMKLCGFCGIGNPASFRETLAKEGYNIVGFRAFRDHQPYSAKYVDSLTAWAKKQGAHGLITTQKDFVKLKPFLGDFPVLALKVELFMEENFDLFLTYRLGSLF